jgi:hypothetical protein
MAYWSSWYWNPYYYDRLYYWYWPFYYSYYGQNKSNDQLMDSTLLKMNHENKYNKNDNKMYIRDVVVLEIVSMALEAGESLHDIAEMLYGLEAMEKFCYDEYYDDYETSNNGVFNNGNNGVFNNGNNGVKNFNGNGDVNSFNKLQNMLDVDGDNKLTMNDADMILNAGSELINNARNQINGMRNVAPNLNKKHLSKLGKHGFKRKRRVR